MKYLFSLLLLLTCINIYDSKSYKQEFKITGGTYDIDIFVFVNDDLNYVISKCKLIGIVVDSSYFEARAVTIYDYGYPIVIWFPEDCKDRTIVNHELFHTTTRVLQWAGIPLNDSTEEAYAFEMQYLSKQLEKKLIFY